MNTQLIYIFLCLVGLSPYLHATEYDDSEMYLRLSVEPNCTVDGQVTLTLTNVSGEKLCVDSSYIDTQLFDAAINGVQLMGLTSGSFVTLKKRRNYVQTGNWSILSVGESVSHQIDFRDYANLDVTKRYKAGASLDVSILKVNGHKVDLYLSSALLQKFYQVEPSCFK